MQGVLIDGQDTFCLPRDYYKKVSKSLISRALIVYIPKTYTRFTHFALNMGNEPMVTHRLFCLPFHIYMTFLYFSEPRTKIHKYHRHGINCQNKGRLKCTHQ